MNTSNIVQYQQVPKSQCECLSWQRVLSCVCPVFALLNVWTRHVLNHICVKSSCPEGVPRGAFTVHYHHTSLKWVLHKELTTCGGSGRVLQAQRDIGLQLRNVNY